MSGGDDTPWLCTNPQCGAALHDDEVRHVAMPAATYSTCPHCGGPVVSTVPDPSAGVGADDPKFYFQSLGSALLYPLRGWGPIVLCVGTFLIGLLAYGMPFLITFLIAIFVYGYVCNYLFDVVLTTANGEDRPPGFPDFTNWWEDIFEPILLVVITVLFSFAPAVLYFGFYLWHCWYEGWVPELDEPLCVVGVLGLTFLCLLYYPMAMLAVVMHNARSGLNPRLVFASIARVLKPYLIVWGFMALTVAVQAVFGLVVKGGSLLAHFGAVFLFLWGLMASMRLLGILYRTHRLKLGWF